MKKPEIDENLQLAQTILGQWLRFREFYRMGVGGTQELTMDDEQAFLDTKSSLAQNIRKFGQRVDEKIFPFRQTEISNQLKSTISISSFRTMAEADREKYYGEWHMSYTYLTRTVGALKFMQEGYRIPEPKKKKGAKGGKGGKKKWIIAVVVLIVVGIVAAVAMGVV